MWLYLFGEMDRSPNLMEEIDSFLRDEESGPERFLPMPSSSDESQGTSEREVMLLCFSKYDNWLICGMIDLIKPVIGEKSLRPFRCILGPHDQAHQTHVDHLSYIWPLYGLSNDKQRLWKLDRVLRYETPRSAREMGIDEQQLPRGSEVGITLIRHRITGPVIGRSEPETASPLDRLTAAMDAAWDEGKVTDEAIEAAIRSYRASHPYGR